MAGLEDLYKEVILDHYRNPRCRGELAVPPATRADGFNPLCGDEISVFCEVVDGHLKHVAVSGQGCSISISSASMMAEAIEGKSLSQVDDVVASFNMLMSIHEASLAENEGADDDDSDTFDDDSVFDESSLGDLVALRGVLRYPRRIKCATLGWNTLGDALSALPV